MYIQIFNPKRCIPRNADYSKTVMYMIKHKDDADNKEVYIGHTVNFKHRHEQHKNRIYNEKQPDYHYKLYLWMREIGWDNLVMIQIEKYPCKNKFEATRREGELIRQYNAFNQQIPGRSGTEWYEDNKNTDALLQRRKEHYEKNKIEIQQRNARYREKHLERALQYHRDYHCKHRDRLAERKREKYWKNRDEVLSKTNCSLCGSTIAKRYLKDHQKTDKCQNIVNNICRDVLYEIIDKI